MSSRTIFAELRSRDHDATSEHPSNVKSRPAGQPAGLAFGVWKSWDPDVSAIRRQQNSAIRWQRVLVCRQGREKIRKMPSGKLHR
jgi:hypothetical protein